MSDLKDALIGLGRYREESRPHIRRVLKAVGSVKIEITYTRNSSKTFTANIAGGGRAAVEKWGYEKYALQDLAPKAEDPSKAFLDQIHQTRKKLLRKLGRDHSFVSMRVEYDGNDWKVVKTTPRNASSKQAVTPGRVKKLIKTLQDVDAEIRGVVGEINTEGDLQNARRLKDELKDHIRNLKRHVRDLGS